MSQVRDDDFELWKGEEDLEPAEVARRNLMDRLQRGELSIAAAEARARKLGIPPLNSPPDPSKYDPMSSLNWSAPMVLAWIMWRNADDVRRHWIEWRANFSEWRSFKRSSKGKRYSHQLELIVPRISSFWFLQNDELIQRDERNAPRHSAEEARQLLWRALRAVTWK